MRPAIVVDSSSAVPLHRQICEAWRDGILSGRFAGGSRVPSTRELAATLHLSRSTVTQAYEQLTAEGYLHSTRGRGTFVCDELPDNLLRARPSQETRTIAATTIRLSRLGARLMDDFHDVQRPEPAAMSLSHTAADLNHFPFPVWHRILNRHLRKPLRAVFDYAEHPAGYQPLRAEIAAYVARSRAVRCAPEQVIVLNGSQQALDLCARLLIEPGVEVAFENPGYFGTRRVLQGHGAKLRPVDVDGEGIRVNDIGGKARVAYVTPSHQFPTGVAMSLARRLALIDWARRNRAVIIEDDYDGEYRYNGAPLPALQGLANGVAVIYCGTFSKVMFPGLRVGYAVVPQSLVTVFTRAKWLADRQTPVLEQAALTDFLREGHLERHVRRMRRLYGQRRDVLIESLRRHFGDAVQIFGEPAGTHVLARFADAAISARAGEQHKVQLVSSAAYYLTKPPRNEFVLGFASLNERAIRQAVKLLAES